MEQQASIISDYYYLKNYGLGDFNRISGFQGIIGPDVLIKYQEALSLFISNPSGQGGSYEKNFSDSDFYRFFSWLSN